MAELTDSDITEFKKLCDKNGVAYDTDVEYREAAQNMLGLAELLLDIYRDQKAQELRLRDHPQGFAFPAEGRICPLCKYGISGDMWYDKWGMKCMDCQQALNKKIVPGYVFKDHDNERHITASQLSWKFNIKLQTIKKLIRLGEIKARVVSSSAHGDTLVFLRTENPELPEKVQKHTNQASWKQLHRIFSQLLS